MNLNPQSDQPLEDSQWSGSWVTTIRTEVEPDPVVNENLFAAGVPDAATFANTYRRLYAAQANYSAARGATYEAKRALTFSEYAVPLESARNETERKALRFNRTVDEQYGVEVAKTAERAAALELDLAKLVLDECKTQLRLAEYVLAMGQAQLDAGL